jgi:hypothetical protein
LPLIRSRISVSLIAMVAALRSGLAAEGRPRLISASIPTAEQIWPGVQ